MDRTDLADTTADRFWEEHYRGHPGAWGARPNPRLVEVAEALTPGNALDLGCGTGGDTLWLARLGWHVTAVDISATAVEQVHRTAVAAGVGEHVTSERHDLAATFPGGRFDLVTAQYFQTPFALPRADVLRTAAGALTPGGLLLVVDHGSTAPWSWNQDPDTHFTTPEEVLDGLELDLHRFTVQRADRPEREATGPQSQVATVTDHVLLVRRTG